MQRVPLADRMRPTEFSEIAGQKHLFSAHGAVSRMVQSGHITNMIFYGPPGTGKTTAANIIAKKSGMQLYKLNATTASLSDVRAVADETRTMFAQNGILLYLDEIQYFNKKQQQSLLEFIEDGRITLIASTTENPFFYVYGAILSRCAVFEFKPVTPQECLPRLRAALDFLNRENISLKAGRTQAQDSGASCSVPQETAGWKTQAQKEQQKSEPLSAQKKTEAETPVSKAETEALNGAGALQINSPEAHALESDADISKTATDDTLLYIASLCGGDVRRSLGLLDNIYYASEQELTKETADVFIPEAMRGIGVFSPDGDDHFDLLSAFQKSIRGSDADAAVFYLAKLLSAGELLSVCRRLQVIASEDIGAAYPMAAVIVRACCESAKELGLPEARIPLSNAVITLATAPKSNSANMAYDAAMRDIEAGRGKNIPPHLRDAHYSGAQKLGRGLTYQYPHDFPGHYVRQQYLPDDLKDSAYYVYAENKTESAAKAYMDKIKNGGKEKS